ncbi:hypothetical protein SADUNF_Sadunf05G0199000 [Salix dunnii]|uniref:Uncharacterized protein n=1 Tax=Salix dunnii TaxID=1413687 RepID=A0A835K9C1_9ROSI|nr:hypothetical protein SADUNF_Sadunf05G0199000 [Salix dunnii]
MVGIFASFMTLQDRSPSADHPQLKAVTNLLWLYLELILNAVYTYSDYTCMYMYELVTNENVDNKANYLEDYMVGGGRVDVGNEIRKLHVLGGGITGLRLAIQNTISMLHNTGGVRHLMKLRNSFFIHMSGLGFNSSKSETFCAGISSIVNHLHVSSVFKLQASSKVVKASDRNVMRFCGKVRKALLVRQVAWNVISLPRVDCCCDFKEYLVISPLIKTHGSRIAVKSGLSADAEVADVIRHSAWCWPNARPEEMEEVQCAYSLTDPSEAEDQFIWKPS